MSSARQRLILIPALFASLALTPPIASADSATVQIGDSSYSQWTTTVPVGSTVTFTNVGALVHTATSVPNGSQTVLDTGGLAPGQSKVLTFTAPGNFPYTSAPDCINGNNPGFNCAGPYVVVVVGPDELPPPAVVNPVPGNVTVYIDDNGGFQPNALTISAGQSIMFVNRGQSTHSAVADQSLHIVPWDTGGLAAGESKLINFPAPGSFPFHSSTEPIMGHDAFGQSVVTGYVWNGVITVR